MLLTLADALTVRADRGASGSGATKVKAQPKNRPCNKLRGWVGTTPRPGCKRAKPGTASLVRKSRSKQLKRQAHKERQVNLTAQVDRQIADIKKIRNPLQRYQAAQDLYFDQKQFEDRWSRDAFAGMRRKVKKLMDDSRRAIARTEPQTQRQKAPMNLGRPAPTTFRGISIDSAAAGAISDYLASRQDAERCGTGWEGVKGQCKRSKKSAASGKPSQAKARTAGFEPIDRKAPDAQRRTQQRTAAIDKAIAALEAGRFNYTNEPNEQKRKGKAGAITALRDAKNPKVGLLASRSQGGEYTGFMSYKPGRREIEIENFGTDQSEKGSGRRLFQQLLAVAARDGKGISAASTPDAAGFYEKMGMRKEGDTAFFMAPDDVKTAYAKLRSRTDSLAIADYLAARADANSLKVQANRADSAWGVWLAGRRTPIVVGAGSRSEAISAARTRKRRGGDDVASARKLTGTALRQAQRGDWVREGPDGEAPGQSRLRGYGPAKKDGARLCDALTYRADQFNTAQPRDDRGRWTSKGARLRTVARGQRRAARRASGNVESAISAAEQSAAERLFAQRGRQITRKANRIVADKIAGVQSKAAAGDAAVFDDLAALESGNTKQVLGKDFSERLSSFTGAFAGRRALANSSVVDDFEVDFLNGLKESGLNVEALAATREQAENSYSKKVKPELDRSRTTIAAALEDNDRLLQERLLGVAKDIVQKRLQAFETILKSIDIEEYPGASAAESASALAKKLKGSLSANEISAVSTLIAKGLPDDKSRLTEALNRTFEQSDTFERISDPEGYAKAEARQQRASAHLARKAKGLRSVLQRQQETISGEMRRKAKKRRTEIQQLQWQERNKPNPDKVKLKALTAEGNSLARDIKNSYAEQKKAVAQQERIFERSGRLLNREADYIAPNYDSATARAIADYLEDRAKRPAV